MWAWAAATFLGVGRLRPGPGTWASVAATLLWSLWGMPRGHRWGAGAGPLQHGPALLTLAAAALVTALGIPAATRVEREAGREDPGFVVIDEVAGQWLTLAVCRPDWAHALLGLLLFRLFDITKPWPARRLEALHGGLGIMLDDLAAGAYGMLVLLAVEHWR
jgi:phosphatidylglycerophosphatase A